MKHYLKSRLVTIVMAGVLSVPAQAVTVPDDVCVGINGCIHDLLGILVAGSGALVQAATCSSQDGTASCSCLPGQRCISAHSQCYCEAANRSQPPSGNVLAALTSAHRIASTTAETVPTTEEERHPSEMTREEIEKKGKDIEKKRKKNDEKKSNNAEAEPDKPCAYIYEGKHSKVGVKENGLCITLPEGAFDIKDVSVKTPLGGRSGVADQLIGKPLRWIRDIRLW